MSAAPSQDGDSYPSNGGRSWYVCRKTLRDYLTTVAFRTTT
ncbi:hypothetical protein [Nonomuraea basaltis]|nr:hypothetical protein [Nonomuraea basaltis]